MNELGWERLASQDQRGLTACCSGDGARSKLLTTSHIGLALGVPESPWVKSNAPGPSDVPAAKEYPSAAGHVCTSVPLSNWNFQNVMSW